MNYNWDWSVFFKSTGVGSETYLDWYITGLGWTIAIAISAWIIALLLGSVLGVMRTVPNRLVSGIATIYVELFRNVPLLVQLFIWYFLVPDLLPEGLQEWFKQDLNPTTSALISVVICLGLFTAARVCEQVRTGIQALPRGQESAALALVEVDAGLTHRRVGHDMEGHDDLVQVLQVLVVGAELIGEEHALVDQRAARQRHDVEAVVDGIGLGAHHIGNDLAQDEQAALEVVLRLAVAAGDEDLARDRFGGGNVRRLGEGGVVDRPVAPAQAGLARPASTD